MRALPTVALLLGLCVPAGAQCFNLDFGGSVPSAHYGGAAGTPGTWNLIQLLKGVPQPLRNVAGAPTDVALTVDWFDPPVGTAIHIVPGQDGLLLNDFFMVEAYSASSVLFRLSGLEPGDYAVYLYAWSPDHPVPPITLLATVHIEDGVKVNQKCGDHGWKGWHILDKTYVTDLVDTRGTFFLAVSNGIDPAFVNGLQVRRIGSCDTLGTPYCDQGLASGCDSNFVLSGEGPFATTEEDFRVELFGVPEQRGGRFYFGVGGRTSTPWNGGTFQCVLPPLQRTLLQDSGGSGNCNGVLHLNFNKWLASNPTLAPPPGTTIYMQGWTEGAGGGKGHLHDAVEFAVQP